jgi:hypothetical protein
MPLHVGQILYDNDPRYEGRRVEIVRVEDRRIICKCGPREVTIRRDRVRRARGTSQGAKSPAEPAAISVATRAIPSSASPRPAPSSASAFGVTSAPGSMSQAPTFRNFPTSSSPAPNRPDRHHFCPCYVSGATEGAVGFRNTCLALSGLVQIGSPRQRSRCRSWAASDAAGFPQSNLPSASA